MDDPAFFVAILLLGLLLLISIVSVMRLYNYEKAKSRHVEHMNSYVYRDGKSTFPGVIDHVLIMAIESGYPELVHLSFDKLFAVTGRQNPFGEILSTIDGVKQMELVVSYARSSRYPDVTEAVMCYWFMRRFEVKR